MKSIAFYTLGCKVNQADTASMEQMFHKAGYAIVDFSEEAQIYVINTCVVTNMGQSKSRKIIHRAVRQNPQALIVVTGCYPQTSPEEVAAIPGVDLLVGNQDRQKLLQLVEEARNRKIPQAANLVHPLTKDTVFDDLEAGVGQGKNRAFLKIQEGCNQFCTYCIIPYARGPLRSRPLASITKEVEQLVADGYQEVVLLGIHLGCYGKEIVGGPRLVEAVKAALAVEGLQRLRLGSLESIEVDDELLDLMLIDSRLCRHLHLPLQAGSDKTLKAMHRPYDTAKFKQLLQDIRAKIPEIAITTDLIVGFPGEDEQDFVQSLAYAKECEFSKIHLFPYSKRQGTPAAVMPLQVPETVKQQRMLQAEKIDSLCHEAFVQQLLHKEVPVLWELKNKDNLWEGFTSTYVRIYADSNENLAGKIMPVKTEKCYEEGLFGSIIE